MKRLIAVLLALCLLFCLALADGARRGSWQVDWFDEEMQVEPCVTLVLGEYGGTILLWPTAPVTQVTVDFMTGFDNMEALEIWNCETLEPYAMLKLLIDIPDGMPNLRVTCVNEAGETERWYITDSGEDGHMMLLPAADVEYWNAPTFMDEAVD